MTAEVTFTIGEVEIKVMAGVPQLPNIDEAGRDIMTINNALSKVKSETELDLKKLYPTIKDSAVVRHL